VAESFATPSIGPRPMEALTSRRSQGTRVGHTNSFRRRITRLGRSRSSASTQRHLTSATEHERALTRRELALRAVAMGWRRSTQTGTLNDKGTRAGSSSGEPALPCRGRLARRGHHLALRPALGCATGAATNHADGRRSPARRQARRHDARPHSPHRSRGDGRSGHRTERPASS